MRLKKKVYKFYSGNKKYRLTFYRFGGEKKPSYLFVAGIHGNESNAIYTAFLLIAKLTRIDEINCTITILPRANPPAVKGRLRLSPEDGRDMARSFPGDPNGSITEKIAYMIFQEAVEHDYVIDIHNMSLPSISFCSTYFSRESIDLAIRTGLDYIVESKSIPGTLSTAVSTWGIPAIEIEVGGVGKDISESDAEKISNSLLRMLLNKNPPANPKFLGIRETIRSPVTGFFYPMIRPGSNLTVASKIGIIKNVFRRKVEVLSGFSGICIAISHTNFVTRGQRIASISRYLKMKL